MKKHMLTLEEKKEIANKKNNGMVSSDIAKSMNLNCSQIYNFINSKRTSWKSYIDTPKEVIELPLSIENNNVEFEEPKNERVRKNFTQSEVVTIISDFNAGISVKETSNKLNRRENSIYAKLKQLGFLPKNKAVQNQTAKIIETLEVQPEYRTIDYYIDGISSITHLSKEEIYKRLFKAF